jgi:hypothetical protein
LHIIIIIIDVQVVCQLFDNKLQEFIDELDTTSSSSLSSSSTPRNSQQWEVDEKQHHEVADRMKQLKREQLRLEELWVDLGNLGTYLSYLLSYQHQHHREGLILLLRCVDSFEALQQWKKQQGLQREE